MISTIAVEELRVGMYVHLDGGWLSHPFPLSAFRIAHHEEINTLRGLGLKRVRWVPEKSELAAPPAAAPVSRQPTAAEAAEQQRRDALATQRAAAQLCERQHAEAALAWREASDAVAADPLQAGSNTLALTQAMLDKMLAAEEVAIRLVNGGGDRAAAHALNVAVVAMLIGRTLGMGSSDMLDIGVGALLHDVGKQELPQRLHHAEDGFNAAEMAGYRDHVAKGVRQGQRMGLAEGAMAVLAQHHEHADGSGFPQHLTADRMHLGARVVAIVNRYDNLCNPGTRSLALTPHEAVATLFAQGRSRFDPPVLNAFIRMMGVYPAGSLVQLTDDRFAMVVSVNSSRPLKPRVLVHGAAAHRGRVSGNEALLLDLEGQPNLGIRRSLSASKVPPATLAVLDPRPRVAYYFEALPCRAQPAEPTA
jgi:putative nucleotidyltransferase with HDIG domain